jgi:hypothetical protein
VATTIPRRPMETNIQRQPYIGELRAIFLRRRPVLSEKATSVGYGYAFRHRRRGAAWVLHMRDDVPP